MVKSRIQVVERGAKYAVGITIPGKTVSPTLTLIDPDHLRIRVKILFVKKSFVWERIADTASDAAVDTEN